MYTFTGVVPAGGSTSPVSAAVLSLGPSLAETSALDVAPGPGVALSSEVDDIAASVPEDSTPPSVPSSDESLTAADVAFGGFEGGTAGVVAGGVEPVVGTVGTVPSLVAVDELVAVVVSSGPVLVALGAAVHAKFKPRAAKHVMRLIDTYLT